MNSAALTAEKIMASASDSTVFGSFFIAETELALPVEHLQEVVLYPDRITPMPLAPDYLLGFFNLRGIIIPIIDLAVILHQDTTARPERPKVAIIEHEGIRLGVLFDNTGEILRIHPEEHSTYHYPDARKRPVISGAIKLGKGARLLQVLDPLALIHIENIPQLREHAGTQAERRQRGGRQRCISFLCAGSRLAFNMDGIQEIIKVPKIQRTVLVTALCLGSVQLRGQAIPVIDFSKILGAASTPDLEPEDRRIIVMKIGEESIGLLVDAVENILRYYADEVLPIPLLIRNRVQMFLGCLPGQESTRDIILLHSGQVLSHHEIENITRGHHNLYRTEKEQEKNLKKSGNKFAYLSFQIGQLYGLPLSHVSQIIYYPHDVITAPGLPPWIVGLHHLRGRIIPIIDPRLLYGLSQPAPVTAAPRVLLLERGTEKFGLMVDRVESILHVHEADITAVPPAMYGNLGRIQSDVQEVIAMPTETGEKKTLIVLNLDAITTRFSAILPEPESASAAVPR